MQKKPWISQYCFTCIGIALCVVLLVIFFWDAASMSNRNEMEQIEHQLQEIANLEADYVKNYIENLFHYGENVAYILAAGKDITSNNTEAYLTMVENNSDASDLFLITTDEAVYFAAENNMFISQQVDYTQVLKGENLVSEVMTSPDGRNVLCLMWPVVIENEVAAILGGIYDTAELAQIVDITCFEGQGYVQIFQSDGTYIVRSRHSNKIIDAPSIFEMEKATFHDGYSFSKMKDDITRGKSGFTKYTSSGGAERYAYYRPVGIKDWYVMTVVPTKIVEYYAKKTNELNWILALKLTILFCLLIFFVVLDLTKQRKRLMHTNAELMVSDQILRIAVSYVTKLIFVYDFANGSTQLLKERPASQHILVKRGTIRQQWRDIVHPTEIDMLLGIVDRMLAGENEISCTFRIKEKHIEEYHWYRLTMTSIFSEDGTPIQAVGILEDIQEQKKMQKMAETDPLTGIFNRSEFERRVTDALKTATPCILMLLDIDDFKIINDKHGHQYGDEVLCRLTQCLNRVFHSSDIIGRLGGDEFVIFMQYIAQREIAEKRIQELQNTLAGISLSIGFVITNEEASFEELYNKADIALYQAKNRGKNQYVLYGEED